MPFHVMLFLLLPLIMFGAEPDFYVWQRQHIPEVQKAVRNYYKNHGGKLYFIAGELENNGRSIAVSPSECVDFSRSVPVIRVHIKHMKKRVPELASELQSLYQPWQKSKALQIDLDAPESKISYYRELMKELRRRLPGVELSATVLPCHVRHEKEFRKLAEACDYYVLQVHGLSKEGNRWFILDGGIAFQALDRAKKLGYRFKTALPLYCNWLKNGTLVIPDMNLVSRLAAESSAVIGFRLGIPGDETALDLETASAVCYGKPYRPELQIFWEKEEYGIQRMSIRNRGYFPGIATFECQWTNIPLQLNAGVFNGATFRSGGKELRLPIPAPGESKVYFWVRSKDQAFTIKLKDIK